VATYPTEICNGRVMVDVTRTRHGPGQPSED
jgi:hypothetical protein